MRTGRSGHSGISLIEKIARSIATTINATTTPMPRMTTGSRSPSTRLSSTRTSFSKVSATLSSISSSRPVSSPTRTMCTASTGNRASVCIPAAIVPPRFTPSASRPTPRPNAWLVIMSPTTASAPMTGTPLLSIVPSVRAKRAVSTRIESRPTIGSPSTVWSHASRPSGVPVHTRLEELREPPRSDMENPALLAGPYHVDVQARERARVVLGERLAERRAATHAVEQVGDDRLQARARRELLLDRQRAVQREPRLDQGRELLGEREEVALADARGDTEREPARTLGLRRHADREVGVLLEPVDNRARVGRLHHAVDGLAPSVGCP